MVIDIAYLLYFFWVSYWRFVLFKRKIAKKFSAYRGYMSFFYFSLIGFSDWNITLREWVDDVDLFFMLYIYIYLVEISIDSYSYLYSNTIFGDYPFRNLQNTLSNSSLQSMAFGYLFLVLNLLSTLFYSNFLKINDWMWYNQI